MIDDADRIRVLYLTGAGRSGGTLIGRVLGQVEGFAAVGELHDTWQRNLLQQGHCACHRSFAECAFWAGVFDRAFGGLEGVDAQFMHDERRRFRFSHRPDLMFAGRSGRVRDDFADYLQNLARLYRGVRDQGDSRVIVDTSRTPSYGLALSLLPDVDVYILHLIRDVRGVARSWSQPKQWLESRGTAAVAYSWWAANVLTELLFRSRGLPYRRLRYEDFLEAPRTHIEGLADWLGTPVRAPFDASGRTLEIDRYHGVVGNPDAFVHGPVRVKPADDWQTQVDRATQRRLLMACAPLMRRYGYI